MSRSLFVSSINKYPYFIHVQELLFQSFYRTYTTDKCNILTLIGIELESHGDMRTEVTELYKVVYRW